MRISLLFLMSFCAYSASAQLKETFDNGNFTSGPVWQGDANAFYVNNLKQLQTLSSPVAQTCYLSTPSTLSGSSAEWEFFVQLNFSPSANNLVRIYLMADNKDLKGPLNGYFLQVGETGNLDSYDLYRQTGTTVTRIMAGKDQSRANINQLTARIRVTRNNDGLWQVSSDNSGGRNFDLSGSATDKQLTSGQWFGIYTKYTATNSNKFIFDDVAVNQVAAAPKYTAKLNEVVINELFADPSPVVGLPAAEFIELFNLSKQTISLSGWTFSNATVSSVFGADSIRSGEYLVVCARADTARFRPYGKTAGLSPWPSLTNTGELLILKNDAGSIINQVSYKDSWYKDDLKKEGGWTLELIDPEQPCLGALNWKASTDKSGGTPGKQNAVYKMGLPGALQLSGVTLTDSIHLQVAFNRPVDSVSASVPLNYSLNNGGGNPVKATPSPDFLTVTLQLKDPLAGGQPYQLTVSGITDCSGGPLAGGSGQAGFFYPKKIGVHDLLISEILFNPRPGGSDFVEIYNPGPGVFDLRDLSVSSVSDNDSLTSIRQVSTVSRLIFPQQYVALTVDPENIKKEYLVKDTLTLLKMASLPAFNDDQGTVVLLTGKKRIDQFSYSEKMHFPLIKNKEGVSLERSSFLHDANEPGNFRSAAGIAGFATPGDKNSQYNGEATSEEAVFLSSKTFSPDNDGFEDELQVNYHFMEGGKVGSASIYSDRGVLICRPVKNTSLAVSGSFTWNGLNSFDQPQPAGIYLLVFDVFDLNGKVSRYKKNCVLAVKLNR